MNDKLLSSEHFNLIEITPETIHELFRTKSKDGILNFFGIDEDGYKRFLDMHEQGMQTHRVSLLFFLIISKETGKPIGECGFHTWNKTHGRGEIFYALRNESDKNKGYMSEVLPVVLDYGFTEMNLNRVEAYVAVWNIPSVKLLLKYHFTKEGTARGHYFTGQRYEDSDIYALLKEDWKSTG